MHDDRLADVLLVIKAEHNMLQFWALKMGLSDNGAPQNGMVYHTCVPIHAAIFGVYRIFKQTQMA
jgi:hypothetical protein